MSATPSFLTTTQLSKFKRPNHSVTLYAGKYPDYEFDMGKIAKITDRIRFKVYRKKRNLIEIRSVYIFCTHFIKIACNS